jgi:hypothetical protein
LFGFYSGYAGEGLKNLISAISKEAAMKKSWVVFIALLFLFAPWSHVPGAELAKQGEGTLKMAHILLYECILLSIPAPEMPQATIA